MPPDPNISPSPVRPSATLGALVAERPARASLLEALRLEYCCGGRQTLAEACAKGGLDIDTVRAALEALDATSVNPKGLEDRDWRRTSIAELCSHIVLIHHDGLREALPRIEDLLSTLVRVHGAARPELSELQRAFIAIRAELEPHLAAEEDELFPACLARERHGAPIEERLLERHEREHTVVGHALAALRVLGRDYDRDQALCNTHRALLDALAAFELDLRRHIHEENNILLPRMRELGAPAKAPLARSSDLVTAPGGQRPVHETQPLPRCCQAWIAEQSRAWVGHRP
jgi:regulator of cell morphogenesis and NO signaling